MINKETIKKTKRTRFQYHKKKEKRNYRNRTEDKTTTT